MYIYTMQLILGKEAQYDKNGKLKNQVVRPKYSGERELSDILEDDRYKSLGCEIECLKVLDTETGEENEVRKNEVNAFINKRIQMKAKPKTEVEELREQNILLKQIIDQTNANVQRLLKEKQQNDLKPENKVENDEPENTDPEIDEKGENDKSGAGQGKTIDDYKAEYKTKFGKDPHPKMKIENIISKVNEQ